MAVSVTQRINQIKQPRGGYLKPSEFEKRVFDDGAKLNEEENISAGLVGLAVDYMTRYCLGSKPEEAFEISLLGARLIGDTKRANEYLSKINGLNEKSVKYACKLVGYDVCFRAGTMYYKDVSQICPDEKTIHNILIMIVRSCDFFKEYGPVVKDGFTFEGAYNDTIGAGDGDFLTEDTLWDFKVSSKGPTSSHTLQLMVYYLMGINSIHEEFKSIKKIGIFNPRLNTLWTKQICDVPHEVINEIKKDVIGYTHDNQRPKKIAANSVNINSKMLDMTEIMRILGCSRYMVTKYHTQMGLPLIKIKNKYYAYEEDLFEWVEQQRQIQARKDRTTFAVAILAVILALIFCFLLLHH